MSFPQTSINPVCSYPLNSRMDATSKATGARLSVPSSDFTEKQHVKCMSQITPIVIGVSKVTTLLKAVDSITSYSGGRMRRRFKGSSNSDGNVKHRFHHLSLIEHKRGTINTRVGLGRGWEKFGQGTTVDSPRRKFKV